MSHLSSLDPLKLIQKNIWYYFFQIYNLQSILVPSLSKSVKKKCFGNYYLFFSNDVFFSIKINFLLEKKYFLFFGIKIFQSSRSLQITWEITTTLIYTAFAYKLQVVNCQIKRKQRIRDNNYFYQYIRINILPNFYDLYSIPMIIRGQTDSILTWERSLIDCNSQFCCSLMGLKKIKVQYD